MKRIAVGQLLQETNTLNPVQTTRRHFEVYGLARGREVMDQYGHTEELSGFAALPELLGESVEWLGLLRARAWSGGALAPGLLAELVDSFTAPLRGQRVDGVLLSLHGAQSAAEDPDVTGALLAALRQALGPQVPLVATLDLHANLTRRMVHSADVLVGYHTFPHIDQVSCGQRAAGALTHLLRTDQRPKISAYKLPLLTNTDGRTTDRGVLVSLWKELVAAEDHPEALSTAIYMAQPWLDVPELGWTLYQAYLGERPPLDPERVAAACWQTRAHRQTPFQRPEELVPAALKIPGRPVAVSESHDATNSGAPGDSTLLLTALAGTAIPGGGALSFCVDPQSVARCFAAGQGATLDLEVGGRMDPYSHPLPLRAIVRTLGKVQYTLSGHGGHNLPVDMGRAAVIASGDLTLVLVEETGPGSSPRLYEAVGLDPRDFKIVIAKSPEGFRQDYEPFAAGILYCGAPGCATPFLLEAGFKSVSRPLYPLDEISDMAQAGWAEELMG
ncbi:MAG: M81 family metallopeptidase [Candidatus Handelsmanbacteria bacterium]|nr:M81 family metallopeptidase [Candidatus Handelsmanbacteria bacterium]